MRRFTNILLTALAAALLVAGTAAAITFGEEDGNAHPYVGLVSRFDDGRFAGVCSGTLVSSTVVVTAAHCLTGVDTVRVHFGASVSDFRSATAGLGGTAHPHESFDGFATLPNTSDLGVVVLQSALSPPYGVLAAVGTLDSVDKKQPLTLVGYGAQSADEQLSQLTTLTRRRGDAVIVSLGSSLTDGYNVKTSNNPGKGHGTGGNCFGDSGGPVLLGDTNVVVALDSFFTGPNCSGVDYNYRLDTSYAQNWLAQFLA